MPAPDASPERDDLDSLRHDLKTPLTTIYARAQLVTRMVRRSPSLTEVERDALLNSMAAIEEAARAMVPRIDGIGRGPPDGLAPPE